MSAIRARLLALGTTIVFVGSTRALQATGLDFALRDCLFAAVVATIVTALAPAS